MASHEGQAIPTGVSREATSSQFLCWLLLDRLLFCVPALPLHATRIDDRHLHHGHPWCCEGLSPTLTGFCVEVLLTCSVLDPHLFGRGAAREGEYGHDEEHFVHSASPLHGGDGVQRMTPPVDCIPWEAHLCCTNLWRDGYSPSLMK